MIPEMTEADGTEREIGTVTEEMTVAGTIHMLFCLPSPLFSLIFLRLICLFSCDTLRDSDRGRDDRRGGPDRHSERDRDRDGGRERNDRGRERSRDRDK